jgi:2-desacetyl-2-hydroxyethyl bacteriochlorophyllide A dehydrogenase
MRAAVVQGDGDLVIRDFDHPGQPGPGQVLVSLRASGVCHTDVGVVEGYLRQGPPPVVPGHEPMGVVAAVGAGVEGLTVGQRVAVDPLVVCGRCPRCLAGEPHICERWRAGADGCGSIGRAMPGGFAEYLLAPDRNIVPLPDGVSDAEGALLVDACATSYHAVRRAAPRPGETALVLGLGGLGQASLRFLRLTSGLRILAADTLEYKLALAEGSGADVLVDAGRDDVAEVARRVTGGRGVDLVVEHTGNPAAAEAGVSALRLGGRLVVAGCSAQAFSVPMVRCCLDEISILGSHGFTHGEILEVAALIDSGAVRFDDLVSHRLPLSELPYALQMLSDPEVGAKERPVRIVIDRYDA